MSQQKLIKGRKYVITGAAKGYEDFLKTFEIKYPQIAVAFDDCRFMIKDKNGVINHLFSKRFVYKSTTPATIEIYKSRGQFKFRVKSSNGKVLNHLFNSKQGCKKGIKALEEALQDYIIVDKTK